MPTAPAPQSVPRWNLENLFAGGSASTAYRAHLDLLRRDLESAEAQASSLPAKLDAPGRQVWIAWILSFQDLAQRLESAESFAACLTAADVHDDAAHGCTAEVDLLASRWLGLQTHLESFAAGTADADWQRLLDTDELRPISFALDEVRRLGREKMAPDRNGWRRSWR